MCFFVCLQLNFPIDIFSTTFTTDFLIINEKSVANEYLILYVSIDVVNLSFFFLHTIEFMWRDRIKSDPGQDQSVRD